MSYFNRNKSGGFIKAIFIVVVAIIILSFFVDLKSLTAPKYLQDNYQYLKTLLVSVWTNYISSIAYYIWNKIFVEYIYKDLFTNFILPKINSK